MEKISVQFPEGEDIEAWQLTRLIATATRPSLKLSEGVDCVAGKRVYVSEEVGMLPVRHLSKAETETLTKLFKDLPKVRAGMSESETNEFMNAFRAHPDKPDWEPYFVTEGDITKREYEIQNLQDSHMKVLKDMNAAGSLISYDINHIPTKLAGFNVFVSRATALQYLKTVNIYEEGSTGSVANTNDSGLNLPKQSHQTQADHSIVSNTAPPTDSTPSSSGSRTTQHLLVDEPPRLPPRAKGIGRIVIKAAWQITRNQGGKKATADQTYGLLLEWSIKGNEEWGLAKIEADDRLVKWWTSDGTLKEHTKKGCGQILKAWYEANPDLFK